ncbi:MAG: methylmalonyl-CoA epimerase [bacterium]
MAECNETIVSLEQIRDIYGIALDICDRLIKNYDICARQLFKLAEAWDKFKFRKRKTTPNDHTGAYAYKPNNFLQHLSHVAIAVKDISVALKIWQEVLGLRLIIIEEVPEQKVRVAILELNKIHIELLEPTLPDSTVAKFIEKRGEGLHHIAFEVDNIEETLDNLKKSGVKLIDEKPRQGAQGSKIAFIHPQSTGGVLLELCQH